MNERDIEKALTVAVTELGGLSYKFISSVSGVPDRIVIYKNRVYFVEVKTLSGTLSSIQKKRIDDIMKVYKDVYILYGIEDVNIFIKDVLK